MARDVGKVKQAVPGPREAAPLEASEAGGRAMMVAHTCSILRLLSRTAEPLGVNAIARELSIAPSSCFNILKSLRAEGFVEFEERNKAYSLGIGVAALSRRALDPTRAFAVLRADLEEMAQKRSIAIGLWRVLQNRRIVLIGFCEDDTHMRIHMTLGQRLPRLIGAVGRMIAANLDLTVEEIRAEFDDLSWQASPSFEAYVSDVERARKLGYALDVGNFAQGVTSVATTIRDDAGEIHFGISGIMFNGQHDESAIEKIGGALVDMSRTAGLRLGLIGA